jgi:hypothetical protein
MRLKDIREFYRDLYRPLPVEQLPERAKARIVRRDGRQCVLCHRKRRLQVHHIDQCGVFSVRPNNHASNLVTLCQRCHLVLHRNGVRFTWELVGLADERRNIQPINLPYTQNYVRNSFAIRPHKAVLLQEDGAA